MKIFIDDRMLRLLKPDEVYEGQVVLPGSLRELRSIVMDFEKDSSVQELGLSSPDYKKLKKEVKSLFTVVKAAGGLVRNEQGEILFIYRRGRWDLPKGKMDIEGRRTRDERRRTKDEGRRKKDEGRRTNFEFRISEAIREVKEETGLEKVEVVRKLKPTYHVYKEKRKPLLKKTWWFEMFAPDDQPLTPQTEEDILYARWFQPEELSNVLENTFASLMEMIMNAQE